MRRRCRIDPNYMRPGVFICDRWQSYEAFAKDMGPHPGNELMLERKDNNGPYTKLNCIWATRTMQNRNKRTIKLTWGDIVAIRSEYKRGSRWYQGISQRRLASKYGVARRTIVDILNGRHWVHP